MAGACHLPLEWAGIEQRQPELRNSRGHDGKKEDGRATGREKWHFCHSKHSACHTGKENPVQSN